MIRYFQITNIKIANAAVNLGTLFVIGIYAKELLVFYAGTLALVTICSSIWDAGAATLNSEVALDCDTAYCLNIDPMVNRGLKVTAVVIAIIFCSNQDVPNYQLNAAVCIVGILPTTYLLRWGTIKRRSGHVVESVILSETVPALTRFALIPVLINDSITGFLIYYLLMIIYAYNINTMRTVKNLRLFSIDRTETNGRPEISRLYFSLITALKDQVLTIMSPFMSQNIGIVMVVQQRVLATAQILLSGVHALLPVELKERKYRSIFLIFFFTFVLWLALCGSANYLMKTVSTESLETVAVNIRLFTWMILWSPIITSVVITIMIAGGRAKGASLIEIIQTLALIFSVRDF
jgi:hypothetical protein